MNKTSRQLFEEYYSVHSEAYADFTQSADGRYCEWEVQHGWRSWQGGYAGVDAAKAELISLMQSVVNVTATWSDPHLSHVALDRSMKSLEEIVNKLAEKSNSQNSSAKDHIRALADKIIADYKEHYDFPTQGESHMHDCITSDLEEFAKSEKAPEPAGFQVRNSYSKNEWTGCHGFATTEEAEQCGSEWRYVYTATPEFAEIERPPAEAQKDHVAKRELIDLYKAVNEMMLYIGMYGEVAREHQCVKDVMNALHALDDGNVIIRVNDLVEKAFMPASQARPKAVSEYIAKLEGSINTFDLLALLDQAEAFKARYQWLIRQEWLMAVAINNLTRNVTSDVELFANEITQAIDAALKVKP